MNLFLAISILSLFTTAAYATTVGINYNPYAAPNLPSPEHVAAYLTRHLKITAVNLQNPHPSVISAFSSSNISLLITLPNPQISLFAENPAAAAEWVHRYVLPFHPRVRISLISLGTDAVSALLLPAMRNLQKSLRDADITTIPVSTSFSFLSLITTASPPSAAELREPILIRPVLQFLAQNNASFLIDVFPYKVFKLRQEIPVGFAIFTENPFYFRHDLATKARYSNLFDMMVDGVAAALAKTGHQDIPLIVTQTGWPNAVNGPADSEVSPAYAQMYLKGLMSHLRSRKGTPLKKEGVAQVYIHELFDDDLDNVNKNYSEDWGILYPNMTRKVNFAVSGKIDRRSN